MAQEAPKEPTMEEILASIRKIISEDDSPRPIQSVQDRGRLDPDDIEVTDDEAFETELADVGQSVEAGSADSQSLSFEDLVADVRGRIADPVIDEAVESGVETAFEADDDDDGVFETEPFETEPFETGEFETASFDEADEPAGLAGYEEEADEVLPPPPMAEPVTERVPEPSPAPALVAAPRPEPAAASWAEEAPKKEVQSMAQPVRSASLTEESTADAAASALARLVSKMDMGSETTLEGIVRELLKPMLKEWLDENLRDIVETKVEAEVERIARLAR